MEVRGANKFFYRALYSTYFYSKNDFFIYRKGALRSIHLLLLLLFLTYLIFSPLSTFCCTGIGRSCELVLLSSFKSFADLLSCCRRWMLKRIHTSLFIPPDRCLLPPNILLLSWIFEMILFQSFFSQFPDHHSLVSCVFIEPWNLFVRIKLLNSNENRIG